MNFQTIISLTCGMNLSQSPSCRLVAGFFCRRTIRQAGSDLSSRLPDREPWRGGDDHGTIDVPSGRLRAVDGLLIPIGSPTSGNVSSGRKFRGLRFKHVAVRTSEPVRSRRFDPQAVYPARYITFTGELDTNSAKGMHRVNPGRKPATVRPAWSDGPNSEMTQQYAGSINALGVSRKAVP